jgi:anaerobic magnesium-protoporphyrin IX monomethyl ester cyclase
MRILLLNPPFFPKFSRSQRSPAVIKSGTLYYPLWLAYATGVLEAAGHQVRLLDAPGEGLDLEIVKGIAEAFGPRLIVLDTSTPSIFSDLNVAAELKRLLPQAFVTLVGSHVSAEAEATLAAGEAADAVARQEYDYTLRDLAAALEEGRGLETVEGLSFRRGKDIVHNPERPKIEDLDALPFVSQVYARHLQIENYFYSITRYPEVTIVTGRGCPHRCFYCVYPQTMFGRRFRHRSPENVLEELRYIKETFPQVREIFIEDDTLTVSEPYCRKVCRLIIDAGLDVVWSANSRADVNQETLRLMKAAGCRLLCIGVESGNQHILDNIRKKLTLEQVEQFVAAARKVGILVHACFMVGNPGETRRTMENTLAFAKRLRPDTAQFFPLMVYPGTEAYTWASGNNFLTTRDFSKWVTPEGLHNCVLSTPELSAQELVDFCDHARRSFYLRTAYVSSKLAQIVRRPEEAGRILRSARIFFKYLVKGSKPA